MSPNQSILTIFRFISVSKSTSAKDVLTPLNKQLAQKALRYRKHYSLLFTQHERNAIKLLGIFILIYQYLQEIHNVYFKTI